MAIEATEVLQASAALHRLRFIYAVLHRGGLSEAAISLIHLYFDSLDLIKCCTSSWPGCCLQL